ncbi:MAG: hypothetical protein HC769_20420 [Cyanobacteria bacterium CRU_2_1]|nr:hypothetical protein [Cyanobacteria bacterium CRU_2_1]
MQKREAEIARSQSLRDIALEVGRAETPEAVLSQLPVSKVRQTLKCDR